MITMTFNGAMNTDNIDLYEEIFSGIRQNPNGCQIKGMIICEKPNIISLFTQFFIM